MKKNLIFFMLFFCQIVGMQDNDFYTSLQEYTQNSQSVLSDLSASLDYIQQNPESYFFVNSLNTCSLNVNNKIYKQGSELWKLKYDNQGVFIFDAHSYGFKNYDKDQLRFAQAGVKKILDNLNSSISRDCTIHIITSDTKLRLFLQSIGFWNHFVVENSYSCVMESVLSKIKYVHIEKDYGCLKKIERLYTRD